MSRNGNIDHRLVSPSSPAFMRRRSRLTKLKRIFAVLPLIGVLTFTFNGSAPAEMQQPGVEAPVPDGRWSQDNAQLLLAAIRGAAQEGLDPADYQFDALSAALSLGQRGAELDALAERAAMQLAHDYAVGRVADRDALDWHIPAPNDDSTLAAGLYDALDRGQLSQWLNGLLPDNEQYRALRAAYAGASDPVSRDLIRANLERWRWMPRDLGERYLYVNVPSYRLAVIEGGVEMASYNVVVGSPKTPTPQLALMAQSIVANPSWTLPPSVLKEGGWQKRGYQVTRRADGSLMVRQPPGPRNALGRIKIDMPNPHAIYLHDTPNKRAFARADRALSHGCVRVENVEQLAASLYDGSGIEEAVSSSYETRIFQLERSIPVYLVYFTAEVGSDGALHALGDPYGRDEQLLQRLDGMGRGGLVVAAR